MIFSLLLASCASPEPPSVLLITVDTTRADHLSPYGYADAVTPTYDRLADEGVVFERAYTTCPLTIPSHSSILTGLTPPAHGVRDNGDFILSDDLTTLAERFRAAGYSTAAITSAFPTQRRWGFGQGFDVYHDPLLRRPDRLDWSDERQAEEVIDDALGVLPELDGPAFVWVHLFDAHRPYRAPERWTDHFPDAPYDAEIAYASEQLGRLLDAWDARHPRSVVTLVADHGEGMGDGGEVTHGFLLYDGTVRVPLIVRGRGLDQTARLAPGSRVSEPVSTIDIAPTLLVLAGVETAGTPAMEGHDLRDGGSDLLWSEALTGQYNMGLAPLFAFTDADGRFTQGAWSGWYPFDGQSVAVTPDPDADLPALDGRFTALRDGLGEAPATLATLDPQELSQLAALGYMGGDPGAAPGEVDPRDVIDLIPLTWSLRQALAAGQAKVAEKMLARLEEGMPGTVGVELARATLLARAGRLDEAVQRYVDIYLRVPTSTVALQVAELWQRMGDAVEAESWYEEALAIQPASPNAMAGLVHTALALGEPERARQLAERYLVVYPDHADLILVHAELLLADGDLDEARAEAERALEAMPGNPLAYEVTAQILWEQGAADAAIDLTWQAVALDPWYVDLRLALVTRLLELKRAAESVRVMAPVAQAFPDNPQVQALQARAQAALDAELGR